MRNTTATGVLAATILACGAASAGCMTLHPDDAERFRDPVPLGSDVALAVPGAGGAASGASTSSTRIRVASTPASGAGDAGSAASPARYYELTRDLADGVDLGTAVVLGSVWLIVRSAPTTIAAHQAVWGPLRGDALSPVSWKLTVNEVGDHEYDYELDGRGVASTSDADWKPVLTGHGYGIERSEHRSGWFQWDDGVMRALDPTRATPGASGTTRVTFDLRATPTSIRVERAPGNGPAGNGSGSARIDVVREAGGAGDVSLVAQADVDGRGALEDVTVNSRWTTTGAGRAVATITGGDVPSTVVATECWSATFARVYYADSIGFEPTTGASSACAL